MDNPSIHSYIKMLSEQLEGDEALFSCMPKGILTCPDKKVIHFLENDAFLLLKRSYCFKPKNSMLAFARSYGVDIRLSECIRRIKESPYAISFHIMSSVSKEDGIPYSKKSFEVSIYTFNLADTIGDPENYRSLSESPRLADCREIFRGKYEKKIYSHWLQSIINILPHGKSWHDRNRIFSQLERLETGILWLAENNISTFLWK